MSDAMMSAQVILRPRGRRSSAGLTITSANVADVAPEPATAARVARYFKEKGFEVGPLAGISFSIAAPAAAFEKLFGKTKALSLPLASIDPDVAAEIEEVTFTPPPDFGPTSFS